MKHRRLLLASVILLTTLALNRNSFAQSDPEPPGTLFLSNTSEPETGSAYDYDQARIPFTVGYNQNGYNFTGASILFADNTGADFTNITLTLYSANSPDNLDFEVASMNFPAPGKAGLYNFTWPTNIALPAENSLYPPTYYILLVVPTYQVGSTGELNMDYTTSTNFDYLDAWTLYPNSAVINSTLGLVPIFNIFATIAPPPKLYPIILTNAAILPDKSFQFGFTNSPGLDFDVYATTNLALNITNWLYGGSPEYIGTNYYQFNVPSAFVTNPVYSPFYFIVTSP